MFEQEFNTEQLTITDSNFIVSPTSTKTVRITPCREYHLMDLTPVLNLILILHIVYKWEFVAFRYLTERRLRSCLDEVIWRFSECVHHGGRDPVLPIPGPPPRSVHPHRWKSSKIKILKNNFKSNCTCMSRGCFLKLFYTIKFTLSFLLFLPTFLLHLLLLLLLGFINITAIPFLRLHPPLRPRLLNQPKKTSNV